MGAPVRTTRRRNQVAHAIEVLSTLLGRPPTASELAKRLHISRQAAEEILGKMIASGQVERIVPIAPGPVYALRPQKGRSSSLDDDDDA